MRSQDINILKPQENNFCVQEPSGLGGSDGNGFFSGTEDCLYLDIKRPKKETQNLLPVMFWIHGGGNTSGLKDLYDFSTFVKNHEVLVVTINYRLGPFGWFTHPSIQGLQSGIDKTSNFGTLDIIAALEWVQSNIELFGGDPGNVTIFGESAGGHNVLSLLLPNKLEEYFIKLFPNQATQQHIQKMRHINKLMSSSTSKHTSWNIVDQIIKDKSLDLSKQK